MGELNLGANYTWLAATYQSTEVVDGSSNSSNAQAQAGLPGVQGTATIQAGDRIPLVPRQIFKLFADLELGNAWSLGLDMTAVGGSFARGNENNQHQADGSTYLGPGRSAGYAVFNLSTDYRPTRALKFFAQVNNLFNRRYNTASQLGAAAFDANANFQARPLPVNANGDQPLQHSTFFAPGAPRTFIVGMKYSYGDRAP